MDEQFVVRLPPQIAKQLKNALKKKPDPGGLPLHEFSLRFEDERHATLNVGHEELSATLMDLPCIIESYKTHDGTTIFKSNDVSQILVVHDRGEAEPDTYEIDSGITPPTTKIRSRRFEVINKKRKFNQRLNLDTEVNMLLDEEANGLISVDMVDEDQLASFDNINPVDHTSLGPANIMLKIRVPHGKDRGYAEMYERVGTLYALDRRGDEPPPPKRQKREVVQYHDSNSDDEDEESTYISRTKAAWYNPPAPRAESPEHFDESLLLPPTTPHPLSMRPHQIPHHQQHGVVKKEVVPEDEEEELNVTGEPDEVVMTEAPPPPRVPEPEPVPVARDPEVVREELWQQHAEYVPKTSLRSRLEGEIAALQNKAADVLKQPAPNAIMKSRLEKQADVFKEQAAAKERERAEVDAQIEAIRATLI